MVIIIIILILVLISTFILILSSSSSCSTPMDWNKHISYTLQLRIVSIHPHISSKSEQVSQSPTIPVDSSCSNNSQLLNSKNSTIIIPACHSTTWQNHEFCWFSRIQFKNETRINKKTNHTNLNYRHRHLSPINKKKHEKSQQSPRYALFIAALTTRGTHVGSTARLEASWRWSSSASPGATFAWASPCCAAARPSCALGNDLPMTDPWCCYIWCAMDPMNIPPLC